VEGSVSQKNTRHRRSIEKRTTGKLSVSIDL
jgi:hypothetical protein